MFEPLSRAPVRRSSRPLAFALVVHSLLIVGAVELRPSPPPKPPRPPALPALLAPSPSRKAVSPSAGSSVPARAEAFPAIPAALSFGSLPTPTGRPVIVGSPGNAPSDRFRIEIGASGQGVGELLDQVARMSAESATPPVLLDPAGVESRLERLGLDGAATVRCVVDRRGRVIPRTIVVTDSTGSEVAAAARNALVQVRYRPGRIGGVAAEVEIRQRFTFTPRR